VIECVLVTSDIVIERVLVTSDKVIERILVSSDIHVILEHVEDDVV